RRPHRRGVNLRDAMPTNASLFDIVNVQNWPAAPALLGAAVPVARSLATAGAAPLTICRYSCASSPTGRRRLSQKEHSAGSNPAWRTNFSFIKHMVVYTPDNMIPAGPARCQQLRFASTTKQTPG